MKQIIVILMACAYSNIILAQIKINSEPSGAKVYQEGKYIGITPCTASTNMKTKHLVYDIDADKVRDPSQPPYSIEFTITKEGYEPAKVCFEGKYEYHKSGWVGGGQKYYIVKPKSYNLFAVLKKNNQVQPTITNSEQQKQNSSAIENSSKIRWHFDSDPDNARIFWRVISSDPKIENNTELLYLGKTPFDETKPLNINGLTSENSNKVEIEIEIVKKGYVKQNKKFSSNLLFDQKEISWFFDLQEEVSTENSVE